MMDEDQILAMRAIHADMDPEKAYGGITKLWVKPADHPFNKHYQWHDIQYDLARAGILKAPNSKIIDDTLLEMCLKTAGTSYLLRIEAYIDREACRVWGYWFWPDIAKE